MAWLAPAIIATMAGTGVLAVCFLYLYRLDRREYLKIWAMSWSIYFTRYAFMLAIVLWKETAFLVICNQVVTLLSGVLLLYGSLLFVGKKFPRPLYLFALLDILWIITSVTNDFPFMLITVPTFGFLAFIYIWTGTILLKAEDLPRRESMVVGVAFIIWGLHKANYPFLRPVAWFAPWGYLLAALLGFVVALGLIIVYFRKARDELQSNQRKLQEHQDRLLSAQRIARIGDWSWNPATDEVIWSGETYRIFGQDPENFEVSMQAFEAAIHPDDYPGFLETREHVLNSGTSGEAEYRIVLPDGKSRHVRSIASITHDEQGNIVNIAGTVQDISERKKAQEALIQASEKWRNILVNTPQIGMSLNTEAEIVFVNEQFLKLTGWSREQALGRNWFDLCIPEDTREEVRLVFEAAIYGKDTYDYSTYENTIVTRSGELRTVAWSNVLSRDDEGSIVDITCLGVDLTERKTAQHEIEQQKRLFETMFNTIPDGVVITDTSRRIRLANKGMKTTFGYEPEELTGEKTSILYAAEEEFRNSGRRIFEKHALQSGRLYITRYKDKSGRKFSGETFAARLYDEENRWIGNLGIMRDISEREQAELRIQQAQKMESIGNLAGGIAHDFNNILFPIIGIAEMLKEDLRPGSQKHEHASQILYAGQRGSELVQQILAFSRQREHEKIPVRLQRVVREVVKLCRSTIPANIEIDQSLNDCGLVMADSTQLHQVGMNLITNAYHAVQDAGGRITVELQEVLIEKEDGVLLMPPGRYVCLTVADNGVGIPPEYLDKIFEPYFTTKEQGRGTGLGLSVVYGIVKDHGGDVRVVSEPNVGTSFKVFLPVMDSSQESELHGEDTALPTGSEHILLVDDEMPIVSLEKKMLERLGYRVSGRTSSSEALEAFKQNPDGYDLVITDMAMPCMTGKELAARMLDIRPDIPIILCTGFSERFGESAAKSMGIRGFLMKPVVRADLAREVRKVLQTTDNTGTPAM